MDQPPIAGYSGTPLVRKLGIRPGHVVLLDHAPAGFALDGVDAVTRLRRDLDVTLTFHLHERTLAARFLQLVERTVADGAVWVCWPKKAARASVLASTGEEPTLDEGVVRSTGLGAGMVDVKIAALDETWSGLKFVRRLRDR